MRITTFRHPEGIGWGLLEGDGIIDLSRDPSLPYADASEALRSETVMDLAMSACGLRAHHPVDEVELLAPLPSPRTVLLVTEDGITELERVEVLDPGTTRSQGRPMLAAVVGSPTTRVPVERGVEHLLGAMDVTLHDAGGRIVADAWLRSRDETGDLDLLHGAGRGLAEIVSEASHQWDLHSGDVILLPAAGADLGLAGSALAGSAL